MTTTATYNNVKTNIAWMPELPEHWKLSRVKNYFTFSNEVVGEDYSGFNVLSLSVNGVIIRDMESGKGKHSMSMDLYQIVQPKSIILCLFDMDVTPRIVGLCENLGIITSAYTTIVPKENVCERFYYYFFLHQDYNKSLKAQGTGVRTTLTNTQFGAVKIPVPPYQEQIQIANYLDNQSQKINHFIAKKQQFIALLKEQRQSVINEAVKKGTRTRLKNIVTTNDEALGESTDENYLLRYIDIGNVNSNGSITDIQEFTFKNAPSRARRIVKKGDIIISTVRTYLQAITLINEDDENLIASTGFAVLRPKENVDVEFLNYALRGNNFIDAVNKNSYGVSYPAINSTTLSALSIFIPNTKEEQTQIVNHIKTETATIDTAIAKTEREIELIKEYKEAMIAEAVMGKVNFNKK